MAVAFDAASSSNGGVVASLTFSHTCSGSDRLLVVGCAINSGASAAVSGVTYNGVAMTSAGAAVMDGGNTEVSLWYLVAPATGANNIVVSISGTISGIAAGGTSFTGVDQATPVGTYASANGNSSTASVSVSSESGGMVIDIAGCFITRTLSVGSGQTQRFNTSGGFVVVGAGSTEPGASSVTMSWSLSSADNWAIAALPIKAATGGAGVLRNLNLLGVGQ